MRQLQAYYEIAIDALMGDKKLSLKCSVSKLVNKREKYQLQIFGLVSNLADLEFNLTLQVS